ncbi:hypothetical protein [Mesorhizobium australicum]|uniref:hypothetical protein n=1 Tax=Mesorhizobium australicum TaxID=536018 RepID=UPI00333875A3
MRRPATQWVKPTGQFGLTGKRKCGCQSRPAIQSIRALAGFDFRELLDDANPFDLGEAGNSSTLRLDAIFLVGGL